MYTVPEQLRSLEDHLVATVAADQVWRARIAVRVAAALAPFGLAYAVVFTVIGLPILAASLAFAGIVVGSSPWVMRRTGSAIVGGHTLTFGLVQSLLGPSWFLGGVFAACVPWLALCTAVATVVAGRAAGLAWALMNVLIVFVLYGAWLTGVLPATIVDLQTEWFLASMTHAGFFIITGGAMIGATASVERQRLALEVARASAQLANRTKSDFLANMSHELRTPMNAILGYAEMLEEDVDPAQQADLSRIHAAGTHLLGLINDVLDLSKVEAGQMRFDIQAVDVRPLVQGVLDQAAPLLATGGNQASLHGEGTPVLADPVRLTQCVLNLVSNAAKFTVDGTIRVELREQGGRLAIAVIDTGEGMTADQLDVVFMPFVQAHRGRGGTGLGLAIVREFVTQMNGEVSASSRLGVGTTFTLLLPLAR